MKPAHFVQADLNLIGRKAVDVKPRGRGPLMECRREKREWVSGLTEQGIEIWSGYWTAVWQMPVKASHLFRIPDGFLFVCSVGLQIHALLCCWTEGQKHRHSCAQIPISDPASWSETEAAIRFLKSDDENVSLPAPQEVCYKNEFWESFSCLFSSLLVACELGMPASRCCIFRSCAECQWWSFDLTFWSFQAHSSPDV